MENRKMEDIEITVFIKEHPELLEFLTQKATKIKDDLIEDWEFVDPLTLIKAIDETMNLIEGAKLSKRELTEQIYNLLFLVRHNTMLMMGFIKIMGEEKIKKAIKDQQIYL